VEKVPELDFNELDQVERRWKEKFLLKIKPPLLSIRTCSGLVSVLLVVLKVQQTLPSFLPSATSALFEMQSCITADFH